MIRLKGELRRRLDPATIIKQAQTRSKMTSPKGPIHFGAFEVTKQVKLASPPPIAKPGAFAMLERGL